MNRLTPIITVALCVAACAKTEIESLPPVRALAGPPPAIVVPPAEVAGASIEVGDAEWKVDELLEDNADRAHAVLVRFTVTNRGARPMPVTLLPRLVDERDAFHVAAPTSTGDTPTLPRDLLEEPPLATGASRSLTLHYTLPRGQRARGLEVPGFSRVDGTRLLRPLSL